MDLENLIITDRRLGEGGFGSVIVCKLGEKEVAAKKLSQSEKELTNLISEAARLKRLRHGKHIAYTYGFTKKEEGLYMVMEYSERWDLQNYLKMNRDSVTYEQKLLFCRGILLGLLYCHSMKVFHGDIKCSNVILGENLEPKLTDFGLSMTVDNIKDYCKTQEGSIYWAAPELFSMDDECSFKEFEANPYPTDIYSLGATFCQVSFDGAIDFIDSDDIEMDISLGLVSPVSKDGFLEEIVGGCCQFERNERISLDECLSMLNTIAESALLVPAIDDKWLNIQQDIKVNSKLELPPSFILYRPAENLVIGPSNLSLLEWLCISDCIEAVEYMIQLYKPEKKQLEWLYNISVFCKSPNTVEFLQSILQDNIPIPLKLSEFIDINPWQLIEAFIEAGAKFDEKGLLEKAIERHYNKVVKLIAYNTHTCSQTIICDAINFENAEAVRILVGRISLELRGKNGDTPLLAAINAENVEIVKILVKCNADVHNKNNRSQRISRIGGQHTPLIRAAVKGNHEIFRFLIIHGATIDTEGGEWHSLVQDLEKKGRSAIIQLISNAMRKRVNTAERNHSAVVPTSRNRDKVDKSAEATPLCTAIRNRQLDLVKQLINDGSDANKHDYDEYSPLHWAVIIGDKEIVGILLKAGADINMKTPNEENNFYTASSSNYFNGYTPLHIAIVKRDLEIVKLLIESGANFSLRNTARQTIMEIADNDDKKRIKSIIQECFSATEDSFQWVLKTMGPETVKTLISSMNASIDTLNHFLCIAVCQGNTEAINYLLEHRANVNSKYEDKNPLEWAIFGGHAQIVQILIDQGADIHSKGNNNHNSKGVIEALENGSISKKYKASEVQGLSDTLLHQAASLNNVEMMEILLNAGIEIDAKDNDGYSALYYAALYGCDEVVALLYDKGAKVRLWENVEDSDAIYKTAKHIAHKAAETGKVNIGRIFTDAGVVDFENKNDSVPSHTVMLDKGEITAESSLNNSALFNASFDKITALTEAAKNNQLKKVQLMLDAGADVNAKFTNSRYLLVECVDKSLVDILRLLVEEGADINTRNENGFAPIHFAKDREIAEILITHGADINVRSTSGGTLLIECVDNSLIDMVQFLIEKGADVNARNENGYAPIHYVTDREIAQTLISHGADINAKNTSGRTPLIECVDNSLIDMVQFLVEKGADVNARDEYAFTPIHYVTNREIAEILISHGADVNAKSISGFTPLFECVALSLVNMVQLLIEKGTDVNVRDEDGFAPIHFVKDRETAEFLISHGADVNARSAEGRTPLIEYVDASLVDIVRLLIEKGADVNAGEENGFAPIHYAKDREIAEILITHGADINASSISGTTPLFEYTKNSLVDMVQFLIEKGADVNARTENGYTPMHFVKSREIAELLITHGADINAKGENGKTSLIECVDGSLVDMVQFLMEKGADVSARNENGFAPIHYVKDREIAEILISHGADINARSANGKTPLIEYVNKSLIDIVQFLIEKGADVNARIKNSYTPMHFVKDGEIAEILISHNADINARSADGRTPLIECVDNSLIDIVQFLIEKGVDVNARTKNGYTSMHFVKDREIAEILISHNADINIKNDDGRTVIDVLLEEQNKNLDNTIYKRKKVCELLEYLKTLK